jgi:hypothetical protein
VEPKYTIHLIWGFAYPPYPPYPNTIIVFTSTNIKKPLSPVLETNIIVFTETNIKNPLSPFSKPI